ncbi:hypothetical protein M9Y10_023577 [Tritrichomonas musculus]|uniref:Exportin-1 C-terminal domain-containing protein n=1 Tax=Tritrichomonas musculus TaxID=1915356 RepID=A0ABR2KVI9_9EUKA
MDAAQFENIAINFYQNNNNLGDEARSTIMSICHDPSSLCLFHTFLFNTHSNEAKFLSLQILSANILNGWAALSDTDRNKIKSDLLSLLIGWCSYIRLKEDNSNQNENDLFSVQVQLVRQLDNAIIQILLVDWPHGWPNFLRDFIEVAKTHVSNVNENGESTIYVFINAIYFMGHLSDQIRNNQYLVSARKMELASALSDNFQLIFSFLKMTLSSDNPKVQIEGLNAISFYFQWIDLKIISGDDIIQTMLGPLMDNPITRLPSLKCILCIVSRDLVVASPPIVQLFNDFISRISNDISILEDPVLIETFVRVLSRFITLDRCALMPNDTVIQWMIEYTKMVDDDLLIEVTSMWHNLTKCYILDLDALPFSGQFLVPLQYVLCSRMCKPVEFGGDKNFYDEYSETLFLLLKMHRAEIFNLIVQKIDAPQFNPDEMMPWIFSIGAVSGICELDEETQFLTTVFNLLLRYANSNGNTDNNGGNGSNSNEASMAMVAASFLYISGQYIRFLKSNQQIFNLAIRRIDESILNGPPQMQVVAIYAFKKIAIGCGQSLLTTEFVQKLFQQFNEILQRIPAEYHLTFFEGVTHVVKHNPDKAQREAMTVTLFQRADTIQILTELIPIVDNDSFLPPIESLIHSMFSQFTSPSIDEQSKKSFYDLFCRFIETFPNTSLLNEFVQLFMNDFNALLTVLNNSNGDNNNIPYANAKSLSGFATIIRAQNVLTNRIIQSQNNNQSNSNSNNNEGEGETSSEKFENPNTNLISMLFNNVVVPTFNLIKENFTDYPSLRQQFFILINSFYDDCSLLGTDSISTLLDFIFFGLKHPHPYISELSMNCITNILSQINKCEDVTFVSGFYSTFYVPILMNLLGLLFDGFHSSLFSQITHTIGHLLTIAALGKFTQYTQQNITEVLFKKLHELFPSVNEEEIGLVSNDIVNAVDNIGKLRMVLSDFMIASRQIQITASPSIDEELVEHNDQLEFLNDQNIGNQIATDACAFPDENN